MQGDPVIVTPRTAPPPLAVLRPVAAGLGALALAGLWLLVLGLPRGEELLSLVHLALVAGLLTLATAAAVQLSAATTGERHPRPRLLAIVTLLVPAGGLCLSAGFALAWPPLLALGGLLVLGGLLTILTHAAARIATSRSSRPLHLGLMLGLLGFLGTALMGLLMAAGLALGRPSLLAALPWHLGLAFGVGFGALLSGVSWQLLPMFGRARQLPARAARAGILLFTVAGLGAAWLWGLWGSAAAWLLALAALYHLTLTAWSLARGPSGKLPPYTGIAHLAAAVLLLAAAVLLARGLAADALGAAFGGVALAVLGYLERILPFIVFELHLGRRRPGRPVPKLQEILPPKGRVTLLTIYLLSIVFSLSGLALAPRLLGAALAGMALRLLLALRQVRRAPD
jgi:branched-subunit amino acid transport protein AzlD